MSKPVPIHIVRQLDRLASTIAADPSAQSIGPGARLQDRRGRPLRDLRISVTDRCNFRCAYCMPKAAFGKDHRYLPHEALLSFEEITRLARQFVALGVQKIRITGGEPLLRKGIEQLIEQLATLRSPVGDAIDIAMTTNGSLLERKARALKAAGLQRVTVSLDALDDAVFQRMNDVGFPVAKVLSGIEAAQAAGIANIKVNMVVQRGVNEQQIVPMARFFQGTGVTLRFIEYMDVGSTNGWRMDDMVAGEEVERRVASELPLIPLHANAPGETAQRWGYADARGEHDPRLGEIGVISSVTQAFCGDCNRARLSTEGRLYSCLFAGQGHDLRQLLRNPSTVTDETLSGVIAAIWQRRTDRYSEQRSSRSSIHGALPTHRPEMSYIGG
ncbi:MAG: GTP 3',8-cyclase MoaA [Hydrogenophaga sp.]|jgi:cyclic pyranopterin phosphate synthase|nr:GTP 3',8-cyclase MoaA [Hydrogenophaga sp.]MDP3323276.1 GTP 3',8-cyclase MoaA [Hydrogenophaga sp.]